MATRTKIPGLPIQQEWKVVGVREGKEEPGQKGGILKKFYVDFEGAPDVYWRRKMPASVEVGQSYFGTVSEGDYGPIFRKESPGGGGGGGGTGGARSGGREWQPESRYDPERVARMSRCHAQEMALRLFAINEPSPSATKQITVADVLAIANEFEADVNAAGVAAQATGGTTSTNVDTSAKPERSHRSTLELVEATATRPYPAQKLATFIDDRLNDEQRARAREQLADPGTQSTVLAQLRLAYEEAEGEPLPLDEPGDDIGF